MTIAPRPIDAVPPRRTPGVSAPSAPRAHTGERETTRRNTYAIRIRGHRMQSYNLFDGDVIIIHRHQHGPHQETAMATINQHEVALKELSIDRLGVHLCPADTAMPPVFLHNGDIQVLGMVMGIKTPQGPARHH